MICPYCGATVLSSTLAATPAIGGEDRRTEALRVISTMAICEDGETAKQRELIVDACREIAANALATQPAFPLQGRESVRAIAHRHCTCTCRDDPEVLQNHTNLCDEITKAILEYAATTPNKDPSK